MTYEEYCKQPLPMTKTKLNRILAGNAELIKCFNTNNSHPMIRKYSQNHPGKN